MSPAASHAQWLSPHLLLGPLPGIGRSEGLKKHKPQGPEPHRAQELPSPSTRCSLRITPGQSLQLQTLLFPQFVHLHPNEGTHRGWCHPRVQCVAMGQQHWAVPSEEHPRVSPPRVWSWVGLEGRSPGERGGQEPPGRGSLSQAPAVCQTAQAEGGLCCDASKSSALGELQAPVLGLRNS